MIGVFALAVAAVHVLQFLSLFDAWCSRPKGKRRPWDMISMAIDLLLVCFSIWVLTEYV